MTHRRITAGAATAAALVAFAAFVGACTGPDVPPRPTSSLPSPSTSTPVPAATTPETVDPALAAAETAILTAYRGYWDAKVAAFADPTVDPGPELEQFAVDKAFADVASSVFTFRDSGIKVVGQPRLSPEVSDIVVGEQGSATITDCVDGTDWQPIYSATGESAAAPGQAQKLITTSTAYFYIDHWTIRTSVVDRESPC